MAPIPAASAAAPATTPAAEVPGDSKNSGNTTVDVETASMLPGGGPPEKAVAVAPPLPPPPSRGGFNMPSTAHELHHAKQRWKEGAWQMRALHFINSHPVQQFFVCLLILDVLILFTELEIDANFPACKFIARDGISCCPAVGEHGDAQYAAAAHDDGHGDAQDDGHRFLRFLSSDAGGHGVCDYPLVDAPDDPVGCDEHKHQAVHVVHQVLFWTTVGILGTFEVELLSLVYLLGPGKFVHSFLYILDFFIVTLSLALELAFRFASAELADVAGILIIFRLWRFVRIGHGLVASTYEVQEHKSHAAMHHIAELEKRLQLHDSQLPERPAALLEGE